LLGEEGEASAVVAQRFSGVLRNDRIDRRALAEAVFHDAERLKELEAILHPIVRTRQRDFLRRAALKRKPLVVLDIPLLFETEQEQNCDAVIMVSAPPFLQQRRVLDRPGMTLARLQIIRRRQMPEAEKRRRADYVVPSGQGRRTTLTAIQAIIRYWRDRAGTHWPPRRPAVSRRRAPCRGAAEKGGWDKTDA
jgi:dephospho-CoA kinase